MRFAATAGGITLAALLTACGDPAAPRPATPPDAPPPIASPTAGGTGIVLPEEAFPNLDAFRTGAWWKMFGSASTDPKRIAADLRAFSASLAAPNGPLRALAGRLPDPAPSPPQPAELDLGLPIERRALYGMVPGHLSLLEPLWDRSAWSADEVALAREVATLLRAQLDAPDLAFTGDGPSDRASLRRLATWFREQVGRVDRYAAMTLTMDDGPFVGVPCEVPTEGRPIVHPLRDDLQVEAFTLGEAEAASAVLAVRRGTETLWCRRITRGDGSPYRGARVDPLVVDGLGPYGWRVNFVAGREHAHLYVGPDGRFLFYFVSW